MASRNHNSWSNRMTEQAMNLIRNMKIPTTTNKYGEPTIKVTKHSEASLNTIATFLNKEFGTTVTSRAVANKFHYEQMTKEQKMRARQRFMESKARKMELEKQKEQTTEIMELEFTSEEKTTPTTGVAQVIIRCARLVSEGKMTNEDLLTVIDSL